jgi:hypothetical protein
MHAGHKQEEDGMTAYDRDFARAQRRAFGIFGVAALLVAAFWVTALVVAVLALHHFGIV